uniref:Uncharacterized protein n=1 Tax=Callorhinchus milii TaxID=7868 RepID=A0A4W3HB53_CALMI
RFTPLALPAPPPAVRLPAYWCLTCWNSILSPSIVSFKDAFGNVFSDHILFNTEKEVGTEVVRQKGLINTLLLPPLHHFQHQLLHNLSPEQPYPPEWPVGSGYGGMAPNWSGIQSDQHSGHHQNGGRL